MKLTNTNDSKIRLYSGILSLVLGITIFGLKYWAYHITQSTAILSDALESVVNVVAAAFALWAIQAAEAPPDDSHPYGHGKFEFVTAVFEGGLISFAALLIGYEAIKDLWFGSPVPNLNEGLWVMILAGGLNGILGVILILAGRKTFSMALEADGKHVLTDFFTTIGILLGLGLVKITGIAWLDPAIALLMAVMLAFTGIPLVRKAIDGLMDAAEPELLEKLCVAFEKRRTPGMIRIHHVRAMRNGRSIHVDGHLVVPEFWSVEQAHDLS
jgi:cation diffusion facilitator family transporter